MRIASPRPFDPLAGDRAASGPRTVAPRSRDPYPRQPLLASAYLQANNGSLPDPWHGRDGRLLWTTSGRAAILLALERAGIRHGHRVLVPAYHCPSMVAPILALGATPVFYGLTPEGAPDIAKLDATGRRPADAMVAAHLFGIPADLRGARALCDAYEMALIEDCAHAFAGHGVSPIGSFGDHVVASLTKFFPVLEGGLLLSRQGRGESPQLGAAGLVAELRAVFDVVELWASQGDSRFARSMAPLFRIKRRLRAAQAARTMDIEPEEDASFRVDTALSHRRALRSTQWLVRHSNWPGIAAARRRNFALYDRLLSGVPHGYCPMKGLPEGAVPYVYPFLVPGSESVYQGLRAQGVPVFRWDRRWPGTPELPGDVSVIWSADLLQLSCHQSLSEPHIRQICDILVALCERRDPS